jgi:hypothetical protein
VTGAVKHGPQVFAFYAVGIYREAGQLQGLQISIYRAPVILELLSQISG